MDSLSFNWPHLLADTAVSFAFQHLFINQVSFFKRLFFLSKHSLISDLVVWIATVLSRSPFHGSGLQKRQRVELIPPFLEAPGPLPSPYPPAMGPTQVFPPYLEPRRQGWDVIPLWWLSPTPFPLALSTGGASGGHGGRELRLPACPTHGISSRSAHLSHLLSAKVHPSL